MMNRVGTPGDPASLPESADQLVAAQQAYERGRIEETLRGLGITDTNLIRRGAQIDRAAEQLITQAAASQERGQPNPLTTATRMPRNARARDQERESADTPARFNTGHRVTRPGRS